MEKGSGVHKLPEKLDHATENWVTRTLEDQAGLFTH
jgi:hypothetical protein